MNGVIGFSGVQELIESRARATIREAGIDPHADPAAARAVIAEAIEALRAEAANAAEPGVKATRFDTDQVLSELVDDIAGMGPLQRYLEDDSIEEIWINSPDRVFVARGGRSELTNTVLSASQVAVLVERMLSASGRRLDVSSPFVDASLRDGSRLHVVIPDVTREHWSVNIRKFVVRARSVDDLIAHGMITKAAAEVLTAAVVSGLNIVVSGGTQAGKTTMLNALLGSVPAAERLITCEETFELSVPEHPDWVAMQTRQAGLEGTGQITLRDLIREALRMRPTRIAVGEVRQQEALELLVAMNSGMPALVTIHANSAREAVTKLCTLPLLAGVNISADFVRPTVAACVDLVLQLRVLPSGRRLVTEVAAVPGRVEEGMVQLEPIFTLREGRLVRADGALPHPERFIAAGFGGLVGRSGAGSRAGLDLGLGVAVGGGGVGGLGGGGGGGGSGGAAGGVADGSGVGGSGGIGGNRWGR